MADELDLEHGDPDRADDRAARRRRRRAGSTSSSGEKSDAREDTEVTSRLDRVLDRIAKAREVKGDDELAEVIREDGPAMAQGIMSLTSNFRALRMPVIMVLNVIEPLLAFGRVLRILVGRFVERRQRVRVERAAAQAGMTVEDFVAAGYPDGNGEVAVSQ